MMNRASMPHQMRGRGPQGIAALARQSAGQGRFGDNMLAHLRPQAAHMLKRMGGAGTINPRTGMREFYDPYGDPSHPLFNMPSPSEPAPSFSGGSGSTMDIDSVIAARNDPNYGSAGIVEPQPAWNIDSVIAARSDPNYGSASLGGSGSTSPYGGFEWPTAERGPYESFVQQSAPPPPPMPQITPEQQASLDAFVSSAAPPSGFNPSTFDFGGKGFTSGGTQVTEFGNPQKFTQLAGNVASNLVDAGNGFMFDPKTGQYMNALGAVQAGVPAGANASLNAAFQSSPFNPAAGFVNSREGFTPMSPWQLMASGMGGAGGGVAPQNASSGAPASGKDEQVGIAGLGQGMQAGMGSMGQAPAQWRSMFRY